MAGQLKKTQLVPLGAFFWCSVIFGAFLELFYMYSDPKNAPNGKHWETMKYVAFLFHVLDINSGLRLSGFTRIKPPYPFSWRYQIGPWLEKLVKEELTKKWSSGIKNKKQC